MRRDGSADRLRHFVRPLAGRDAGELLERPGHPAERGAEIGQVDHREQQARDPEEMDMREERQEAQHRDDFHLKLLGLVRHALGQAVQPQEQDTDRQDGDDQEHGHHGHEDVRFARGGDERRQLMRRSRV